MRPEPLPSPRILLCEDDRLTRELVVKGLAAQGLTVHATIHGEEFWQAVATQEPEIAILDIELPGEDGLSIARRLRAERPQIGIIMLTSRSHLEDRIVGHECGADLYFTKPSNMRELATALRSLFRRMNVHRPLKPTLGWCLDASGACLLTPSKVKIPLTDNEMRFLSPLLERPGETVDRETLLQRLEQQVDLYAMRRMETLVSRLRSKVQRISPQEPLPVRARHSRGYAFLMPGASEP